MENPPPLKIGILNAFPPDEEIIDWHGTPVDAYIRFLELAKPPFRYKGYDVARDEFPADPGECDTYLITGSPKGAYDPDPWIAKLVEFIREAFGAGVKLVGICFGHQILANALGGRAEKSEKGWGLGLRSFEISAIKPWMATHPKTSSLYFVHQDQVIELPPGAENLGRSDFCPNTFFVIGDQVLGIQGHPEFTPEIMRDIYRVMEGRRVEPTVLEAAIDSMDMGLPDNQLFAKWIVDFLLPAAGRPS